MNVSVSGHSPPLSTLPLPASLCHSLPLPLPPCHPPLPSLSFPFPTLPLPLPSLANPSTLSVIASVLLLTLYVHVCVYVCATCTPLRYYVALHCTYSTCNGTYCTLLLVVCYSQSNKVDPCQGKRVGCGLHADTVSVW